MKLFGGLERSPPSQLPFLKWAGGKRWLSEAYTDLFPKSFGRYIEPFLGSGAVFFSLMPSRAILSDINSELIKTFQVIRDDPAGLRKKLNNHHISHCKEYYYKVRSTNPDELLDCAARLIYLNRVCYNGLYRVNRAGRFNVPIGTKSSVSLKTDNFDALSSLLKVHELRCSDFEEIIDEAKCGDFVFADPPYTVKHDNNGFIKYNENIFSWKDQLRLKTCLERAAKRHVLVMVSNANHPSIRELYSDFACIIKLERSSVISGALKGRAVAAELIIRNYTDA